MKMAMRYKMMLLSLTVAAGLSNDVRADLVAAGDRQWAGAKILQIQDSRLRFTDRNGAQQAVQLLTVTKIQIDLRDELNRAEDLRAEGKFDEATRVYETALRTESRNDLAGLIRWRLMEIYGRTAQLDRAVEMFVDLARQPDFLMVVKEWRPANVAGAKSKVREEALALLDEALRQSRMGLASEYMRQVRDYVAAGGSGQQQPATNDAPLLEPPATEAIAALGRANTWRDRALQMIKIGQFNQALEAANKVLAADDLPREQLEDAMFVRGAALWGVAKDRPRQLQAGWALARVLIEFPGSEFTPQCQYYLGLVQISLGRKDLAMQWLQQAQSNPLVTEEVKAQAKKAYLDIVVKQ